jgi:hypothetical protein
MARRSRDAGPARRSRSSSPKSPRSGGDRERSAPEGGLSREDQEDREHRAFHARIRSRQSDAEDRDPGSGPPRR